MITTEMGRVSQKITWFIIILIFSTRRFISRWSKKLMTFDLRRLSDLSSLYSLGRPQALSLHKWLSNVTKETQGRDTRSLIIKHSAITKEKSAVKTIQKSLYRLATDW